MYAHAGELGPGPPGTHSSVLAAGSPSSPFAVTVGLARLARLLRVLTTDRDQIASEHLSQLEASGGGAVRRVSVRPRRAG